MKYFKRALALALLVTFGLLVFQSGQAAAFNPFQVTPSSSKVKKVCTAGTAASPACQTYTTNPFTGNNGVIVKAALLVDWIVGISAVAVLLYGGFQYINSRGDAQRAVNARNTILYAVVGIIVAVAGQALLAFAINHLFT